MKHLIDRLRAERRLERSEWIALLSERSADDEAYARGMAQEICESVYGSDVYLRGLIEISSYCKNDCLYCGLRRSNRDCERYRLTEEDILGCCREGYGLGFRTFVMQGGEDMWFTDERLCAIVAAVRSEFPDAAITLSVGEKSRETYQKYFNAGANRYLLRHETADPSHYSLLHPAGMTFENRKNCLYTLKDIGFQVGAGIMVGSPGQTWETVAADMEFMRELEPHMVGIGPFLPHHATPFRDEPAGRLNDTLFIVALVRLMLPEALIPATTALATLDPEGREMGLLSGANVIMPNLSPADVRKKYLLYDNKQAFGSEAAQSLEINKAALEKIGRRASMTRGDHITFQKQ